MPFEERVARISYMPGVLELTCRHDPLTSFSMCFCPTQTRLARLTSCANMISQAYFMIHFMGIKQVLRALRTDDGHEAGTLGALEPPE